MGSMHLLCDDALLSCAKQCNMFAYEHCRHASRRSELIILSLDCAELCRQTSMLLRNKSEKTKITALQCAEACYQLLNQLSGNGCEQTKQLLEHCSKAKRCCNEIAAQAWVDNHPASHSTATVCYGITLPASIYRA